MDQNLDEFMKYSPADLKILESIITGVDEVPGVINREMITNCYQTHFSRDSKTTEGNVNYEDVTHLHLESQCILKIDHLWMLENLTVLSLAHNRIEKIENLQELTNLVELNLSYNKIEKIEGLEGLHRLETLSIVGNNIHLVSGLFDQEHSLRIFSVSKNNIHDVSCITYLQRFKKLVSLSMEGNPCADFSFKQRVAVFLPDLTYYNSSLITDEERKEARKAFESDLKEIAELEEARQRYMKKLQTQKKKQEFFKQAFVDGLEKHDFFNKMFEKDTDGKVFKDDMDKLQDIYDRLRGVSYEVSTNIYEAGARNIVTRSEEVDRFRKNTAANSDTGRKKLIHATAKISSKLNKLLGKSRNYFKGPMTKELKKDAMSLRLWLQGLEIMEQFVNKFLDDQWYYLMSIEMKNFEKNEETINAYDRTLSEIIDVFIEEVQSQFTRLRDSENDCHEEITSRLTKYMNDIYQRNEFEKLPPILQERMLNKETLSNAIDASHDVHLLVIDMKEDRIVSRLKQWHKRQTGDLMTNEVLRNGKVVLQIHYYIENLKKEFKQQICGILDMFKFIEPDENFEENLNEIIKQWLSTHEHKFEVPDLDEDDEKNNNEKVPRELKEIFSTPFFDRQENA